jgi:catechol 2,3-dioxygenase-like lactoylglutathione lyase family enzyme
MLDRETVAPGLRIELFVRDLAASTAFYRDVLGFNLVRSTPGSYAALVRDGATIGLNLAENLPDGHPVKPAADERPGQGVEIVVMTRDVEQAYAQACRSGRAIAAALAPQPWGLSDFRIADPDCHYIRVTSLSPREQQARKNPQGS